MRARGKSQHHRVSVAREGSGLAARPQRRASATRPDGPQPRRSHRPRAGEAGVANPDVVITAMRRARSSRQRHPPPTTRTPAT